MSPEERLLRKSVNANKTAARQLIVKNKGGHKDAQKVKASIQDQSKQYSYIQHNNEVLIFERDDLYKDIKAKLGPGSYDVNESQTVKRVKGGSFLPGARPDYKSNISYDETAIGPGTYDVMSKPSGQQVKVKILKEYYKELGVMRDQQREEVDRRRKEINKVKEDAAENEAEIKHQRLESMQEYGKSKAPFNISSQRENIVPNDKETLAPGPGEYNPINKTIMEGYIKQQMQQEKIKKPEFEWRVWTDIKFLPEKTHPGNKYNLPGAFDSTLKKAKKSNFISKQIPYPSSFGSSLRRF